MIRRFSTPGKLFALVPLTVFLGLFFIFARNDYFFVVANMVAINTIAVTGLNLLFMATGQVSIGQAAFFGIASYVTAILSSTLGVPILISILASLVMVILTSLIVSIPTLRLEGNYLIMATLGFNIIVNILMNQWESITGGPSGFPNIPHLKIGSLLIDSDRKMFIFSWFIAISVLFITINLENTKVGRAFKAIRSNSLVAETLCIPTNYYKILGFVIGSLYAGIAGVIYAHYMTFISPKTFNIFKSLQWLIMVVVGGMGSLWGSFLGTTFLTVVPEMFQRFEDFHIIFYGLLLLVTLLFFPKGLASVFSKSFLRSEPSVMIESPPTAIKRPKLASIHEGYLRLEGVSLSFGGLQVLNNITLDFEPGKIHAVIGPNGAGKTSLINVICGIFKAQKGDIFLKVDSRWINIKNLAIHEIALLGVARTFQITQLFPGSTVLEHVIIGMHRHIKENLFKGLIRLPSYIEASKRYRTRAFEILSYFDLLPKALLRVEELSLFEQKLLEMARAIATEPKYLLLDEPAGGLNLQEKAKIAELIKDLNKKGITIILIDHHMDLIMNLSERVVVLHHGTVIADGSPLEISQNEDVIRAYLGKKDTVFSSYENNKLREISR